MPPPRSPQRPGRDCQAGMPPASPDRRVAVREHPAGGEEIRDFLKRVAGSTIKHARTDALRTHAPTHMAVRKCAPVHRLPGGGALAILPAAAESPAGKLIDVVTSLYATATQARGVRRCGRRTRPMRSAAGTGVSRCGTSSREAVPRAGGGSLGEKFIYLWTSLSPSFRDYCQLLPASCLPGSVPLNCRTLLVSVRYATTQAWPQSMRGGRAMARRRQQGGEGACEAGRGLV